MVVMAVLMATLRVCSLFLTGSAGLRKYTEDGRGWTLSPSVPSPAYRRAEG